MNSKLLAWSAALTLVLTVGCGPSQAPEKQEPQDSQQVQEAAGCPKGQYLCVSCDGTRTFCGDACPDCIPPVAPEVEVEAAAGCPKGQYLCTSCDGLSRYCGDAVPRLHAARRARWRGAGRRGLPEGPVPVHVLRRPEPVLR
ncbi:hypothetical protein ACLESD_41130 [Pyxidicoccus sp. 3LFB2]